MAHLTKNVSTLMQRVQECPWNPFKLHEIVTLEKCLQEILAEDPRFRSIMRKLTTEGVFVEPTRRIAHLKRNKFEQKADEDLRQKVLMLNQEGDRLEAEICAYKEKLDEINSKRLDKIRQITHMKKSISLIENACESTTVEFGLTLERVFNSLVISLHVIDVKIPEYIRYMEESDLFKQVSLLPSLYRNHIIRLIRIDKVDNILQEPQGFALLGYSHKKTAINQLGGYLATLCSLYKDLSLIESIYMNEVPEEIEHLKLYNNYIEVLEKRPNNLPKKITKIYHDLRAMELPNLVEVPLVEMDDCELCSLFKELTD